MRLVTVEAPGEYLRILLALSDFKGVIKALSNNSHGKSDYLSGSLDIRNLSLALLTMISAGGFTLVNTKNHSLFDGGQRTSGHCFGMEISTCFLRRIRPRSSN
jgi:hypothetical protein